MEWTDESIARLRALWQEGLSTAEIGRRMQITKNAVVGKAHRLDLAARPSPIRKTESQQPTTPKRAPAEKPAVTPFVAQQPKPVTPVPVTTVPVSIADAAHATAHVVAEERREAATIAVQATEASVAASGRVPEIASGLPDNVRVLRPAAPPAAVQPAPQAAPRAVEAREPRRRGLTCCWPLGEPGTKGFHFCGADPTPGKPYCAEHASLAYVKLRDRRDSVA